MTDENTPDEAPPELTPEDPKTLEPLIIVSVQVYHDNQGRQVTERTIVHTEGDREEAEKSLRRFEGVMFIQFQDGSAQATIQFKLEADDILGAFAAYEGATEAAAKEAAIQHTERKRKAAQEAMEAQKKAQQKIVVAPASALPSLPPGLDLRGGG